MSTVSKSILLVDDEVDFLDVFGEFLQEQGYQPHLACNATEALAILESRPVDLLLSDINMPGMKGFELLRQARLRFPGVRQALITAYDVRDYLNLAKNHDVGNIITKSTPFNFDEIAVLLRSILTGDIFGLVQHLQCPINTRSITLPGEIEGVIEETLLEVDELPVMRKLRQAAGEIIVNAFFYGGRNEQGDNKDNWDLTSPLPPERSIEVSWGVDAEKFGIGVRDNSGRLSKNEVLYWLERNSTKGANGLSLGLLDDHGKGLFIAQETIDRFIVNIQRNVRTEVLLIHYRKGLYNGHRPLWIQEI